MVRPLEQGSCPTEVASEEADISEGGIRGGLERIVACELRGLDGPGGELVRS